MDVGYAGWESGRQIGRCGTDVWIGRRVERGLGDRRTDKQPKKAENLPNLRVMVLRSYNP
jgi:hypothetical protein